VTKNSLQLLFLDIKVPDDEPYEAERIMESVEHTIERYRPSFKIVFETKSAKVLEVLKRRGPHYGYSLDVEPAYGVVLEPASFSAVHAAIEHGTSFATPQRPRSLTIAPWTTYKRIVKHDLRLRSQHNGSGQGSRVEGVIAFTVNNEPELRCLIRMGIDGIQSDKPDLLRAVALRLGRISAPREHRVFMKHPEPARNYGPLRRV
jgi:glycerophosphoryl diester phosphodiesterase